MKLFTKAYLLLEKVPAKGCYEQLLPPTALGPGASSCTAGGAQPRGQGLCPRLTGVAAALLFAGRFHH